MGIFKVFIQANHKQLFPAKIARYSMQKHLPQGVEVEIMNLWDYPQLTRFEGRPYYRKGLLETWVNDTLQSFTPLRFLPPQLMNYRGIALVVDPDVFALKDLSGLMDFDFKGKAFYCVAEENNGKKAYRSSVMLLDCAKLRSWTWDRHIEDLFALKRNYRKWMSLQYEDENTIGVLAEKWNHCDKLTPETQMIHYTKKITQPWKTGLKVDWIPDKYPAKWGIIPRSLILAVKAKVLGGFYAEKNAKFYLENPFKDQVDLFWEIAAEAFQRGVYTEEEAMEEVAKGNVCQDFMKKVKARMT